MDFLNCEHGSAGKFCPDCKKAKIVSKLEEIVTLADHKTDRPDWVICRIKQLTTNIIKVAKSPSERRNYFV